MGFREVQMADRPSDTWVHCAGRKREIGSWGFMGWVWWVLSWMSMCAKDGREYEEGPMGGKICQLGGWSFGIMGEKNGTHLL